ncbi:MAG: glycosyltransferase family 4 protein [Lentisphaeria bacterium]|nr:glycosyltransferase family 4 protein [Lentisphaeria bacterium]NQZ67775.1 glycosyltransferase family 4 protein [Lentisphaeria bacterium]
MKVLMFGWEFPPHISGGLGTACKGLTDHLCEHGTEITFVMPKVEGAADGNENFRIQPADQVEISISRVHFKRYFDEQTVKFIEIDSILQPYLTEADYFEIITEGTNTRLIELIEKTDNYQGKLPFSGKYGDTLMDEIGRYAVVGRQLGFSEDFDIIHAHDWMTYPAAVEAKRSSNKPLICHIHATEYDRSGSRPNQAVYDMEKFGFENADRIIAVSQRTKDTVISFYNINPAKIFVVHNAVSKDKTRERSEVKKKLDEKIVLFLGRVTMQKGPEYFIEAAAKVSKAIGNVRFVMAGSGDMLPRMIERTAALRMQKNFHFTGFLRGTEVEEMFAMSDLYIMPSVSEPFGITPFEAMLYHVPIIISKQSGIAEVLEHAIKVDFWDVDKLAESIIEILTNDEFAQELAEKDAKCLDGISWDTAAFKIEEHYKELCK